MENCKFARINFERVIQYHRFVLENGLRVLVHTDESTPLVAVNLLYDVGSRNETPEKTGFAHLFEHLMFGGSSSAPSFDEPIQLAGGENNAFTNADITNFYCTIPATNLETILWLEADRMHQLALDEKSLNIQRQVVVEEFYETSINQPYGDVWHLLSAIAFKEHPYRWPTIGIHPSHIENANLEDVASFYRSFYGPNNAILVLSGNINVANAQVLTKKWFGNIHARTKPNGLIRNEPPQNELRREKHFRDVPTDALYLAFHMVERTHPDYAAIDFLSDVLANGKSSYLYQRLYKKKRLCNSIDAYITGTRDSGLFIVEAKPAQGVSIETLEKAIWDELEGVSKIPITEQVLVKLKNKVENTIEFGGTSIQAKAMNLAYFEWLGDPEMINTEFSKYQTLTIQDIQRVANQILIKENCSILEYCRLASTQDQSVRTSIV
jgi:predicted Zn-dependent peptidase